MKTAAKVTNLSHDLFIFALIKIEYYGTTGRLYPADEIKGLWARFNIQWDLRPDVNILSGINGVGKTTILNRSVGYLEQLSGDIQLSGEMKSDAKNGVHLFLIIPQRLISHTM